MSVKYDRVETTTVWSPGAGCHGSCGAKVYLRDEKVVKAEGYREQLWYNSCGRISAYTL